MTLVCTQIQEWVEEEISQPVEEWEERQKKKCKKYAWYDPRGWFCWFVTYLVKVIRWVVVKVGKWVTRLVCKYISAVLQQIKDLLMGLQNFLGGIFTWDWRRVWDGIVQIVVGAIVGGWRRLRIPLLDTIDYIVEEVNQKRLRDYVRDLLEEKYSGDQLEEIKDAVGLDHGTFGLRLNATAFRTYLDSETPSSENRAVPNLVMLASDPANNIPPDPEINIRELCGFEFTEGLWNRKRYETRKKGIFHDQNGQRINVPISEEELQIYLDSRGAEGPAFTILPMGDDVLDTKLDAAEFMGRRLGLILRWERKDIEVTTTGQVDHPQSPDSLDTFLAEHDRINRTLKSQDMPSARAEQCHPIVVAIFRYTADNTLRGLANNLFRSDCGLPGNDTSGCTFIDNKPDHVWKYVPIHELGHYFGLCHVDGLHRIMFSAKKNSWWSWGMLPGLLFKGEPSFTLDEAKAVWDYIVKNFDPECLGARSGRIG